MGCSASKTEPVTEKEEKYSPQIGKKKSKLSKGAENDYLLGSLKSNDGKDAKKDKKGKKGKKEKSATKRDEVYEKTSK